MRRRGGNLSIPRTDRLALAALCGLVALFFEGPLVRGKVFYERDLSLLWAPQMESFVRALAAGSWPLWDPYVAFGQPMLANANYQLLYPLTWLNLVMRPETYFVFYVVLHTVAAAAGQYLLARDLQISPVGAVIGGAAFVASGPFLSTLNLWNHYAAAALLPWSLLAGRRALAHPGWRRSAVWALPLAGQILAGSPDIAAFTVALMSASVIARFRSGAESVPTRRLAAAALCALAFALALSAGQWLPTADTVRRSARREVPVEASAVGALHPVGLVKVLSPVPLTDLPFRKDRVRALFDGGLVLLRLPYLGLAAVGLVLAALAGPPRRGRVFLMVTAAVAVAYALGPHGIVHTAAATLLPPIRALRYPSKALIVAAMAWTLLAAMGFDAWRSGATSRRRWLWMVSAPLAAGTLLCAGAAFRLWSPGALAAVFVPEASLGSSWATALFPVALRLAVAALLVGVVFVLSLVRGSRFGGRRFLGAPAVAVLVLVDLWVAGHDVNRTTDPSLYRYRPTVAGAIPAGDLSRLFVYRHDATVPLGPVENPYKIRWYPAGLDVTAGRILAARLYVLPPSGAAWGLFGSYDPDMIGLYPEHLTDMVRWAYEAHGHPAFRRYLEIGAVRHVVGLTPRGFEDLEFVKELAGPLVLPPRFYRVPSSLPRTYTVPSARFVTETDARSALESAAFDPRREILLNGSGAAATPAPPGETAGNSRVAAFSADSVRLDVEMSRPGYVVLVDAWDPGWKASVDGRAADVLRANVAFRAVAVPAGRHVVEMAYRPAAVPAGLALSAFAWAALLVIAVPRSNVPAASNNSVTH